MTLIRLIIAGRRDAPEPEFRRALASSGLRPEELEWNGISRGSGSMRREARARGLVILEHVYARELARIGRGL